MCLIICRFIDVLDEMFENVRGQRYFKYSYRKKNSLCLQLQMSVL